MGGLKMTEIKKALKPEDSVTTNIIPQISKFVNKKERY